jgi:hypothetical protein
VNPGSQESVGVRNEPDLASSEVYHALSIYYEGNAVATTCAETQPPGNTPPPIGAQSYTGCLAFQSD